MKRLVVGILLSLLICTLVCADTTFETKKKRLLIVKEINVETVVMNIITKNVRIIREAFRAGEVLVVYPGTEVTIKKLYKEYDYMGIKCKVWNVEVKGKQGFMVVSGKDFGEKV